MLVLVQASMRLSSEFITVMWKHFCLTGIFTVSDIIYMIIGPLLGTDLKKKKILTIVN